MKKKYLWLFMFIPFLVNADSGENIGDLFAFLFMEAFVTIHMSIFVLLPISKLLKGDMYKSLFKKLFIGRIIILLFFDFFITPFIAILDFLLVFIGAFIVVPVLSTLLRKKNVNTSNITSNVIVPTYKCPKCGTDRKPNDKFCGNCGFKDERKFVSINDYDSIYRLNDDGMLDVLIKREMEKCGMSFDKKLIPEKVLKRKKILSIIFCILVFIYVTSIFFHFPYLYYFLGLIVLIVYFVISRRYDLNKYLKKQIKARKGEKISNIIMSNKETLVSNHIYRFLLVGLIISIGIPLLLFINPRCFYEKTDGGYALRFYAFGLTNFETAEIPDTYNGEKIVALRGNAFSNMPFLKEVKLSDNIKEIRGEAFYNDVSLKSVNLPKYLEEIHGDSFNGCISLESITIPSTVKRIGGHAFYGCSSLTEVVIYEDSLLSLIGSSAFRDCSNLYNIKLPRNVSINERAFKNSPTNIEYFE